MKPSELHKKIDKFFEAGIKSDSAKIAQKILESGAKYDTKNYFFTKANEVWLNLLWENDFLDIVKTQSENMTKYTYTTPEINYIRSIALKDIVSATFVVNEIILDNDVATQEDKFRPELVEQFLRICSELPANLLIKIIPKIKKQNWVKLMSSFGQWGFEYEKMFGILYKARKIDELINLAEVVLSVKSKTELDKDTFDKNPFYIKDFSYTKVFEYLEKIEGKNKERVLELLVGVVRKIAELGEKNNDENLAFKINDAFHLYDVDFFEDEYKELKHRSHRDSVKDLILFTAKIIKDLIKEKDKEVNSVRTIYKKYIQILPDSSSMWRLKLFVLSSYPEAFKNELKNAFFKLFEVERYHEIISGAEYQKALRMGFFVLFEADKREYIKRVIEYFIKKDKEKENEKENWHIRYGSRILSAIVDQLTEEEKQTAKGAGFTLDTKYKPSPTIQSSEFLHTIISQGPITQEEFDKKSIEEILKLFKKEWTPEKLNAQNKNKDFHKPKNAEGAGNLLQTGVNNRFNLFIKNAEKFFDKGKIDEHYTQAFLRGIQDAIKNGKRINNNEWQPLIDLMKNLVDAKLENRKRKEGFYDTWLANWQAVYYIMTDVLQELLSEKDGEVAIGNFEKYRDDLLHIFKFLLKYKNDPTIEDEKIESASDPYSMAINSVRGRTFQAFLMFIYQDGKKIEKEEIKIEKHIKDLYEEILKKENTRAMMFMYGHHLPTFYFRDKKWTKEVLIPQIFEGKKDKYLKLASIEGYLTQTLYKEIFEDNDFKKLYERWISLENTKYPNQKHFKNVDEALAIHIALIFINFGIDIEKGLIKTFWHTNNQNNQARYYEFISFIGRSVLTRSNTGNNWLKESKISKEKLLKFWDWVLKNIDDKKVLSGFGFWINPDEEILNDKIVIKKMAETLKKSDGDIDWDYGLLKRLSIFAEIDKDNTFKIIKNYLLDKNNNLNQNRRTPITYEEEIKNSLKIIYNGGNNNQQDVTNFINILIEKGSSTFWYLKEILK